jgi:hypothetical protein
VELEGTRFLQVILRGVGLPYDTGLEPFGGSTTRLPGTGTEGAVEIAPGGVFEDDQQAFIGPTGAERLGVLSGRVRHDEACARAGEEGPPAS